MLQNPTQNVWPGWETVRLIGRGSFGSVFEIQRDVFGETEKAAMKVISIPQSAEDIDEMHNDGYDDASITSTLQDHLKSIVAEYSMMRKMNDCANVVRCDDLYYVPNQEGPGWTVFIRMELLTPLTKVLPGDITEETVIKIGQDMCHALNECKNWGIVHRDIKPQNIFLSDRGEYKLGDFGIAKTVEKTMGGTKIGTYKYMAPEVYNNQPYGSAADIYSLGLVLYWLLNERRLPFMPMPPTLVRASDEEKARTRRFSGESLPPPAHGSEKLKKIVLKACAYDPKDRYASAQEMLDALNGSSIDEAACRRQEQEARIAREQAEKAEQERIDLERQEQERIAKEQAEQVQSRLHTMQQETDTSAPKPRNKKQNILIFLCLCVAIAALVLGIFRSQNGWKIQQGNRYYYVNGSVATGWQTIEGDIFYFGNDGIMRTGWEKIGACTYYFGVDGVKQTEWSYVNGNRYYFGLSGIMRTGWQSIDNNRYFFANDGIARTGWQIIDNNKYFFSNTGILQTGWISINGHRYYFGDDGIMRTGWQTIDGHQYYFNEDGVLQQ